MFNAVSVTVGCFQLIPTNVSNRQAHLSKKSNQISSKSNVGRLSITGKKGTLKLKVGLGVGLGVGVEVGLGLRQGVRVGLGAEGSYTWDKRCRKDTKIGYELY